MYVMWGWGVFFRSLWARDWPCHTEAALGRSADKLVAARNR